MNPTDSTVNDPSVLFDLILARAPADGTLRYAIRVLKQTDSFRKTQWGADEPIFDGNTVRIVSGIMPAVDATAAPGSGYLDGVSWKSGITLYLRGRIVGEHDHEPRWGNIPTEPPEGWEKWVRGAFEDFVALGASLDGRHDPLPNASEDAIVAEGRRFGALDAEEDVVFGSPISYAAPTPAMRALLLSLPDPSGATAPVSELFDLTFEQIRVLGFPGADSSFSFKRLVIR